MAAALNQAGAAGVSVASPAAGRKDLFASQPLPDLIALIQKATLFGGQPTVAPFILKALQEADKRGLSLASPEFDEMFYGPGFFEGLQKGSEEESVDLAKVHDLIKAVQRLLYLVTDPVQIGPLMDCGFMSAHEIAVQSKNRFQLTMKSKGMPDNEVLRIHNHAVTIDCRNQEAWIRILQSINTDFMAAPRGAKFKAKSGPPIATPATADKPLAAVPPIAAPATAGKPLAAVPQKGSKRSKRFNMTDIFNLQANSCAECCSVTSAAAYYVDLLEFLRTLFGTPHDNKSPRSVLSVLTARRPDLVNLELSCANSKNKLPYVSIVNEILASYVASAGATDETAIIAINEDAHAAETEQGVQRDERVPAIFQTDVVDQLYPLSIFPYNHGINAVRTYLDRAGVSYLDVLSTFGSQTRVVAKGANPETAKASIARAVVAETLNLQASDYTAIVGTSAYLNTESQSKSESESESESESKSGSESPRAALKSARFNVSKLWGYESIESMIDDDETRATGLCFIRKEFLPRSGLSFDQLVELIDTLYFTRRLVITNDGESKLFSGQISEMRLRALDMSAADTPVVTKPTATLPITTPVITKPIVDLPPKPVVTKLDDRLCNELQSFIRLKNKLGWSISELDNAVGCIYGNQINNGTIGRVDGITPLLLEHLSYVVSLSRLTGIPVPEILPLWSKINTHGKKSLYEKTFLRGAAVTSGDDIFKADENGKYLAAGNAIDEHLRAIRIALRLSQTGVAALVTNVGLQLTDELNLTSLSRLYRMHILCLLLDVSPENFATVRQIFPPSANFYRDPGTTLRLVKSWRQLTDSTWTLDSIRQVLPLLVNHDYHSLASIQAAIQLSRPVVKAAAEFDGHWATLLRSQVVSETTVTDVCKRLFDDATAAALGSLVEGTRPQVSIEVNASSLKTQPPPPFDKLPAKVSVKPNTSVGSKDLVTITFSDTLTDNDRKVIAGVCRGHPDFLSLLKELDGKATAILLAVSEILFPRLSEDDQEDLEELLTTRVEKLPKNASAEDAVRIETLLRDRRRKFVEHAIPTVRARMLQDLLPAMWNDKFPDVDDDLLRMLLDEVVSIDTAAVTERQNVEPSASSPAHSSPLEIIEGLPLLVEDTKEVLSGYFSPETTQDYVFTFPNVKDKPSISINGVSLVIDSISSGWQAKPVALASGQHYFVKSTVNLNQLYWMTGQNARAKIMNATFVPFDCAKSLLAISESVSRLIAVVENLSFTVDEVRFFTAPKTKNSIDFNRLSLADLARVEKYQELRDTCASRDLLLDLLRWLSTTSAQLNAGELSRRLTSTFGWSIDQSMGILEAKYPETSYEQIVCHLDDWEELCSLKRAVTLGDRINLSMSTKLPMELLFQLAVPSSLDRVEDDFNNAAALQACISESKQSAVVSGLREKQRDALVAFLLQQSYIKKLEITEPDQLFEHFLIDVQMGGKLETSRMKQAISTVQLFVQRCLLGLEVQNGVTSSHIKRKKWAWMQKHNVWQATRKAFLYPENWIDPTLRDDKTELFQNYEAAIMQGDLSWDVFVGEMKRYVVGLSQIADLDIQTYLHEVESGVADTYHFFGRTRNAPYRYFYRKVRQDKDARHVFWSPWTKMELDTPTYETDWDGSKLAQSGSYLLPVMRGNRLFLYLPQIMVKTIPTTPKPVTEQVPAGGSGGTSATTQIEKPATFKSLKTQPIADHKSPQEWEIRMAWTEFFDGKWSPKQISEASLSINQILDFGTEALPSLSNFTFATSQTVSVVNIGVGCWRKANSNSFYSLGQFEIREDRIVVTNSGSSVQKKSLGTTLPTKFHKYTWLSPAATDRQDPKTTPVPTGVTRTAGRQCKPMLAVTAHADPRTLTWTLSFDTGADSRDATGLIVDEQDEPNQGRSVFMYPRAHDLPSSVDSMNLRDQSETAVVEHEHATDLMEAVSSRNELTSLFEALGKIPLRDFGAEISAKYTSGRHELTLPYAIHNWEIGLHGVLLAIDRFAATQQFDLALQAARLVFDPSIDGGSDVPGIVSPACWKFPPFRELASEKKNMTDLFKGWPTDASLDAVVIERRNNPSTAHSTARSRPQAYMKWVIMKYIEVLVAAGDEYFRRASLEDLPLAIQRYVEAAYVLGPEPPQVAKLGKPVVLTFAEFAKHAQQVDLELAFPFVCTLERRGAVSAADYDDPDDQSILCFLRTTYFCLPNNPRYKILRNLVNDRLYKTRNNLDINGQPIEYSIDEPIVDPGDLARGLAGGQGGSLSGLLGLDSGPIPYQRFSFLIGKAIDLCNELRSIADQLLMAKEKKDSESMALLKLRQDASRQTLVSSVKNLQRQEATQTLESLSMQREAAVSTLSFLLKLIGEPQERIPDENGVWEDIKQNVEKPSTNELRMSRFEKEEMKCADRATRLNVDAANDDETVAWLRALPRVTSQTQPWGMGVSLTIDSHNIADGIHAYSLGKRTKALIASERGHKAARKAQLTRQLQDRQAQANTKGRDIKNLDKQIEIQRKRLEINDAEAELQKLEAAFIAETQTWYHSKYTNEKLYAWMENTMKGLSHEIYLMANDLARRAERVLRFEKGSAAQVAPYLRPGGYWDPKNDGLLAAQQLALDLKRMDIAYIEKPAYDFEVSKNVSLRQIDPLALVRLRENGSASFSVPEVLYDMDYPGHYYRRIKSVSLSVPCVTGPYTSVSGTLTLTKHKYRVRAIAASAKEYNPKENDDEGSNADQFRTDRIPISAIAVSTGMHDSGAFELNFRDDRFMPFELAGAVSDWHFELPTTIRQFDYQTISDVVLHMRYTALDGGPLLKKAANDSVLEFSTEIQKVGADYGLVSYFDLKNDFSSQWYTFQSDLRKAEQLQKAEKQQKKPEAMAGERETPRVKFSLAELPNRMPYWTRGRTIRVRSVSIVARGKVPGVGGCVFLDALGHGGSWTAETGKDSTTLSRNNLEAKLSSAWALEVEAGRFGADELKGLALAVKYTI
ncbi:hypothetical protein MMC27_008853 [Xylographa pallens]|nr:hypothetical protein [Xylographa pallens]